jgi:sugar lactone lactonase YvrE
MRFRSLGSLSAARLAATRLAVSLLLLATAIAQPGCMGDSPDSPDASLPDASLPDASLPDAGLVDADLPDGGPDPVDAGMVTEGAVTLAGSGAAGSSDGAGAAASFSNPANVALGPDGTVYVADFDNNRIRLVTPAGEVTTLTAQAGFVRPFGMLIAADGTLYVQTDANDLGQVGNTTGTLWRVDLDTGDATVVLSNIGRPRGLAELDDGRLVLVDTRRHSVFLLDLDAVPLAPTLLAGSNDVAVSGFMDATGPAARFSRPQDGVIIDGEIYVTDSQNHRIRKVTLAGQVTTVAGNGTAGSRDGALAQATFNQPYGLARDSAGNLYVSELGGYRIRKVDLGAGTATTIAGTGTPGFHDAEEPLEAQFFGLEGIDVDSEDMYLYVADGSRGEEDPYHRIRRVDL